MQHFFRAAAGLVLPASDWGFDAETGDAVIAFEDGSARLLDIFTSPEELYAYARGLYQ